MAAEVTERHRKLAMRCVERDPPEWMGGHWTENGGYPFSDAAQRTAQALADIEAAALASQTAGESTALQVEADATLVQMMLESNLREEAPRPHPSGSFEALARLVAAALASRHAPESMGAAELEHLEYGARFLAGMLKQAEADGLLVPEAIAWLQAERERRAGK